MRRALLTIVLVASVLQAGCRSDNSQPFVSGERLNRGLVLVLTGIEGRSRFNEGICRGLDAGGVKCAIELVDWTSQIPGAFLFNLRAEFRNRQRAEEIAQRIERYRMLFPRRPVVLVGQSGGGAIAVWTAEALSPEQKVDGIILLAAALSPEYLLDIALSNSERGIVNFYSYRDVVFLAAGTSLAGTMDGVHGSSAGRVGFDIPREPPQPSLYRKLYQIPWTEDMEQTGNPGLHVTSGSAAFVHRYVAPLVLAREWSREGIQTVVQGHPASQPGPETPLANGARRPIHPASRPGVPSRPSSPSAAIAGVPDAPPPAWPAPPLEPYSRTAHSKAPALTPPSQTATRPSPGVRVIYVEPESQPSRLPRPTTMPSNGDKPPLSVPPAPKTLPASSADGKEA